MAAMVKSYPDGTAALFALEGSVNFYQYDIVANPPDTIPRYNKVVLPPEQTEKAARTRHDNRKDAACERIQKYVTDESQPEAVAYVDNLLAPEIGNPALHFNPSLNVPAVYSIQECQNK